MPVNPGLAPAYIKLGSAATAGVFFLELVASPPSGEIFQLVVK